MSESTGGARPRQVTRDVDLTRVADLLTTPRRVSVAFVDNGRIDVWPAGIAARLTEFRFAVARDCPDLGEREVVLLIDDGSHWFELRGISVRGAARKVDAPGADPNDDAAWYEIAARRVLAWDYGSLRTVTE